MSDVIDLIVDVAISASLTAPSLPGTDIPGLIGYHTHWNDFIRTYFSPADMLSDGFTVNDPLYLMASAIAAQAPHVNQFKVIRGTTSVVQVMHFKVTINNSGDGAVGKVVGMNLTKPDGTVITTFTHTVAPSDTDAVIATALAGITISGLVLAVDGGDTTQVNITVGASGAIWYPDTITGATFTDVTPTATPQTDLANAAMVDPNFYGVSGAWLSAANIAAIAAWTESNKRLHAYTTADTANLTLSTGVFATLKTSGYNRSYGQFSGTPRNYGATALMGNRFTNDPGSDTWAFVSLASVAADALTPSQVSAATSLEGGVSNNGNVYIGGVADTNVTLNGLAASGLFVDLQRGIDALSRDIQLRIFTMLKANSDAGRKVPYTLRGASMIGGQVRNSLQSFVTTEFLSNDPGEQFVVTIPPPSQQSPTDRAKRIYRNVAFTATAAGAVQTVTIRGNITF